MGLGEIAAVIIAGVAIIGLIVAAQRYNNNKRSRIYQRLDETKKSCEDKMETHFLRKELYQQKMEQLDETLKEIKAQTSLIPGIAAQLKILNAGRA